TSLAIAARHQGIVGRQQRWWAGDRVVVEEREHGGASVNPEGNATLTKPSSAAAVTAGSGSSEEDNPECPTIRSIGRGVKKPHPYRFVWRGRLSQDVKLPVTSNLYDAGYWPDSLMSRVFILSVF